MEIAETTDYFKHDKTALELMRENLREYCSSDPRDAGVLVCEVGGDVVGFVSYWRLRSNVGVYFISWLAVRKDMQKRGVGRALIETLEAELSKFGARLLLVDTSGSSNWRPAVIARSFYTKLGFVPVALIPHFYWDGDSAVLFIKFLGRDCGARREVRGDARR